MNPVALTIINPRKEYWWSRGSNQQPPVFKSATLTTELWCSLQITNLNLMKVMETSPKEKKTLWKKEKMLVTSNFSFSHSVFKRLVLQTRKNQGCLGKG